MKKRPKWKNSTAWPDRFLRRMLSWVCREVGCPRSTVRNAEFGNRTTSPYSGRAWDWNKRILVRIGPDSMFPCHSFTHGDGFSVGNINDRIEALVKVTAHEVGHLDNDRRGNRSRRGVGWGGSERYTDAIAKRVLEAFRENREKLLGEWGDQQKQEKPKQSAVEKKAKAAFAKEAEYEKKLERTKKLLAKWKKKANYYRKRYPDGEYPVRQAAERKAK